MNLDYIEKGQGEPVLLLHSTAAGNKQWRKLIEILSSNYKGRRNPSKRRT